ncbi:hypothetical protein [Microbulbifer sp. GL-2]|uniref:hypothetical protein n=1 Tax=Microbulbifer sp. GL-2 TaxID=2591606 RepID=UPI0011640B35|nr:hypothetical protein [Microbulbifer sp. GL-2]BBM03837.1 hypothetical protein GL2_39110 [Microbulbifer sp. GL-2]
MKIIFAKLNNDPPHSLSKKDIKRIFTLVPKKWTSLVDQVIFSAEIFQNSRFDRPVIHSSYSSRLNILSRGFSKEDIVKEVFRELGVNGGIAKTGYAKHLPKSELDKLDLVIAPYLDSFLNEKT